MRRTSTTTSRRGLRAFLATALMASTLAVVTLAASPASAAVILNSQLAISGGTSVTVGDALNASLKITNNSNNNTTSNRNEPVRIDTISVVLSCGGTPTAAGACPAGSVDPGVLTPASTGVGAAGTVCAGVSFAITLTDATEGRYSIAPTPLVTLGANTNGATSATTSCEVDFVANVVKVPTVDADAGTAGAQTTGVATVAATGTTSTNTTTSVSNVVSKTVAKGTLTAVVTTVPTNTTVGSPIKSTATLNPAAGAAAPSGKVRFRFFDNSNCTLPFLAGGNSNKNLNAAGTSASSDNFTPQAPGTYYVEAQYDGDANYKGFQTCVLASTVTVAASTTTTKVIPGSVGVGEPTTVGAKVNPSGNGPAPTGTLSFVVYGPNDDTCAATATPVGTSPVAADGTGSVPYSTLTKGTYHFIATYSGDTNYAGSASLCSANPATLDVTRATAPISVATSPSAITIGDSFNATATLTAPPGTPPAYTGNITFTVYGPGDTTCTGTPVTAGTVAVTPAGTAVTPAYAPSAPGTYRVVASYGQNANFTHVETACGAAGSTVDVLQATPTIAAAVTPGTITYGGSTTPSATLTGPNTLSAPTGTVTFSLYGPSDANCTGTPITSTGTVDASGVATGSNLTPTGPGTYQLVASYDGADANYTDVSSVCGDTPLVVGKATPTVTASADPASITLGGSTVAKVIITPPANTTAPTGTVTFKIYGPGDTTCSNAAVFTDSAVTLGAVGTDVGASSASFTPTAAGTYRVRATYNGDSNFVDQVTTGCDATQLVVAMATAPVALTIAPNPGTSGVPIVGTATLTPPANTPAPTGDVVFSIYAPGLSCTDTATATRTTTLAGAGTSAVAGDFTPTVAGTYHYIARYAGDGNFNPTASDCVAVVIAAGPLATLTITPDTSTVTVGDSVTYTATGADAQGNSLGDVTAGTTFTSSPDGVVNGATVTFNAVGPHTVTGTYTATNTTDTATVTVKAVVTPPPPPPGGPTITRLAGADRYGTAVEASHKTFSPGVEAVFIASGLGFADGLAGGPGAAKLDGPVLLTPAGSLPAAVATEINRLKPKKIYILGGTASVSSSVESTLKTLGSVERLSGANRYGTASAIADKLWSSASTVYLASGAGFPDALSGGAAAADDNAPLLLTDPGSLSPETKAAIARLKPSKIVIMGGTAAVADSVKAALTKQFLTADVSRIAGVDRYDTSAKALATTAGASSGKLVLASGAAFPDALSGVPVAAHLDAGFALTRSTCLPPSVAGALMKSVKEFFLMGGTSVLSDSVATTVCSS